MIIFFPLLEVEKYVVQVSVPRGQIFIHHTVCPPLLAGENKKSLPAQYITTVKKASTAVEEIPGKCGNAIFTYSKENVCIFTFWRPVE